MSNDIFDRLAKSKFRSSFHLKEKEIKSHAYDFVNKRLKDVSNLVDGKQTPMRGHPVFLAQHATATCCRGCLEKWHKINKNKILTDKEVDYVVNIIMTWIKKNYRV